MGTNTESVSETVSTKFSAAQFFDYLSTWFFGIVMLAAAIPHLDNPYYFLGSVYSYKLVEPGIGQAVVMILPLLQLVLAVCLILRVQVDAASLSFVGILFLFSLSRVLLVFLARNDKIA
ncbi:MAG: hypothetical protein LBU65_16275 [Planctomycetaceae bacterium]|jgi:hypothetical protein|nr:hypothetical protein [Planctomycetaceae bacterium]